MSAIHTLYMSLDSNTVVLRIDGGICSQIAFAAYALTLQEQGLRVLYDLSFYRESGMDNDGIFARRFDMPKAFANIPFPEAKADDIARCRSMRSMMSTPAEQVVTPGYIGGYPPRAVHVLRHREFLKQSFYTTLHHSFDAEPSGIDKQMREGHSCAVHVRRGDLARFDPYYGHPCSAAWFINSIGIIRLFDPEAVFYFFSDEPSWVQQHIIPLLPAGVAYTLCTGHGSDKGYLDLYLMAQARHIIASKGSLGKMAKLLQCHPAPGYTILPGASDLLKTSDRIIIYTEQAEQLEVPVPQPHCTPPRRRSKLLKLAINLIPIPSYRRRCRQHFFPKP